MPGGTGLLAVTSVTGPSKPCSTGLSNSTTRPCLSHRLHRRPGGDSEDPRSPEEKSRAERTYPLARNPGAASRQTDGLVRLTHQSPTERLKMQRPEARQGLCWPDGQAEQYFRKKTFY